jgi:DNA-binding NarL/FixJ family response regulator
MTNILIVDDNQFSTLALIDKLQDYPEIKLAGTCANGELAVNFLSVTKIDLILMDIEMPIMNGIRATEIIKKNNPEIKVVVITVYDDDDYIFNAIKAGADSYILKETKAEKIYETIIDTLNGGAVMSPSIAVKTLQLLKNGAVPKVENPATAIELSSREAEILELLAKGMTNKHIAEQLFISPFTVKRHIENIYQKLQAHNRIELLDKARQNRLI